MKCLIEESDDITRKFLVNERALAPPRACKGALSPGHCHRKGFTLEIRHSPTSETCTAYVFALTRDSNAVSENYPRDIRKTSIPHKKTMHPYLSQKLFLMNSRHSHFLEDISCIRTFADTKSAFACGCVQQRGHRTPIAIRLGPAKTGGCAKPSKRKHPTNVDSTELQRKKLSWENLPLPRKNCSRN